MAGLAVLQPPGRAAAADILFQAEAQRLSGTCTGQAVRLEGNHNTVSLTGTCGSLLVKGLANTVQLTIAAGGPIRVEGSQNRVRYAPIDAGPAIETFGPDNDVSAGGAARPIPADLSPAKPPVPASPPSPQAAPKPGPLELSGDDQQRLGDCGGRDVVVTGSRSAYVIRGACHSLLLRGDLLTVQAVMQPGARITVNGRGSVVSWAIPGKGHAPTSVVRGAGSRVQRAEAIGGGPVP